MFDTKLLADYPVKPGVYLMKDKDGQVLYVGKANNLKARLKQYFIKQYDDRAQVPFLLQEVYTIDTIVVHSEKEALLLENTLIKRYWPRYNVLLKDDKNFLSLKISTKHAYPMMQLVRNKGAPPKDATYCGPYTSAHEARKMFDLISRTFPLRQCSDEEFARRKRPCLLYQIKRCIAPCVQLCTKDEYAENVDRAIRLLKGQDTELLHELEAEMKKASDALDFEEAGRIHEKIKLIEKITQKQYVEAVHTKELDVFGMYYQAGDASIAKLSYRNAKLIGANTLHVEKTAQDPDELFQSFLLQHYLGSIRKEDIPNEIILSFPIEGSQALSEILSEKWDKKVHISSPHHGSKKKLCDLAALNAEEAFKQKTSSEHARSQMLLDLQEKFSLAHFPRKIECYDNSHLFGTSLVSALVCYVNGEKYKNGYRKFHIKSVQVGDDIGMMREVLTRRFSNPELSDLPDLILIDGGKAQLNVAMQILSDLNIVSVDVLSIAKENARHDKGLTLEAIYHPSSKEPVYLHAHDALLHFLQRIRDEAHRFAISFHKKTRAKKILRSELDLIPGIGPIKKKKLLQEFGSVKVIASLSTQELMSVQGIREKDAKIIRSYFESKDKLKSS